MVPLSEALAVLRAVARREVEVTALQAWPDTEVREIAFSLWWKGERADLRFDWYGGCLDEVTSLRIGPRFSARGDWDDFPLARLDDDELEALERALVLADRQG